MNKAIAPLAVIVALVATAYSFVQKGVADENMRISLQQAKSTDSLRAQLAACAEEARRQQKLAFEAAQRAAEVQRQTEEELRKYKRK